MKVIIALTVAEGKRLIAKAVARTPEVRRALEGGRVLMLGGTTVSAVAEELLGFPMRISGRISPGGLKTAKVVGPTPHSLLIEGSGWRNIDQELPDVAAILGDRDVAITGANVIDAHGGAALLAGAPLGGTRGRAVSGLMAEGVPIVVAAGLEKLIPGTVDQAVRAAGRKGVARSTGMAVGLMPIYGKVVTEVEAVKLLAPVECHVIGKGGVDGAEGGVTLAVWGEDAAVDGIFRLALDLRGATTSGTADSYPECLEASARCKGHLACICRAPGLATMFPTSRP